MDSRTLGRSLLLVVVILSVGALAYKRLAPSPPLADEPNVTALAEPTPDVLPTVEESPAALADPSAAMNTETPKAAGAVTPAVAAETVEPMPPSVIQVVYFHSNFRCQTCTAIEQQSGDALQAAFAAELKAGRLSWSTCNLDKAGNEHFEQDFELTSASLVLTDGRGPKGRWKVLEKTWDLVGDSAAFSDYVLRETRTFLAAVR